MVIWTLAKEIISGSLSCILPAVSTNTTLNFCCWAVIYNILLSSIMMTYQSQQLPYKYQLHPYHTHIQITSHMEILPLSQMNDEMTDDECGSSIVWLLLNGRCHTQQLKHGDHFPITRNKSENNYIIYLCIHLLSYLYIHLSILYIHSSILYIHSPWQG